MSRFSWKFMKISLLWQFSMISILIKFDKNSILFKILGKISIFAKISKKTLDFGQNFQKSRFWLKFSKISAILVKTFRNLDSGKKFRKVTILVDCSQNFQKISVCVKILENLDFRENSWQSRFHSNLPKISILVKFLGKSRFFQNFRKINSFY